MKKIWILLILPFFLTGCYDYQELNNRAVIAGAAIDYKEEEFFIDLEILNNKKGSGQEENENKTYYIGGSGKTVFHMAGNDGTVGRTPGDRNRGRSGDGRRIPFLFPDRKECRSEEMTAWYLIWKN